MSEKMINFINEMIKLLEEAKKEPEKQIEEGMFDLYRIGNKIIMYGVNSEERRKTKFNP